MGGMATVYLANDIKHGREVAIKVLRPDLTETLGRERPGAWPPSAGDADDLSPEDADYESARTDRLRKPVRGCVE